MSKNRLIFLFFFIGFLGLILSSLFKEVKRNNYILKNSLSGVVISKSGIMGGIIKTDNAHIFLFHPETLELVASKIINPFLPPLTFSIGQEDSKKPLNGSYRLLILTDKNRDVNLSSDGEVIGPLTKPYLLGTEGIEYVLDRPFKRFPPELMLSRKNAINSSIRGIVRVSKLLLDKINISDRLVIMLFDENLGRPVAIKILESFNPPQKFSIGQENAMGGQILKGKYSLRILTDKNNQPFHSVEGEIIGRSNGLIPLGTDNLEFELNKKYLR